MMFRLGSFADITTAMELVRFVPHKQKRFTTRPEPACNARARHIGPSREGLCAG